MPEIIDFAVFIIANLYNLLMVGIFLSRPAGKKRLEQKLGILAVALGIPLLFGVILNLVFGRDIWLVVLPLPLVIFMLVEWLLEYRLHVEFRKTRWLGPYLLLYYLGLFGMIGYSFMAGRAYGFITLASYFLSLFASLYSYRKVGHG